MMRARLNAKVIPVQLPIESEDNFIGVVDLVRFKSIIYLDDLGTEAMKPRFLLRCWTAERYRIRCWNHWPKLMKELWKNTWTARIF